MPTSPFTFEVTLRDDASRVARLLADAFLELAEAFRAWAVAMARMLRTLLAPLAVFVRTEPALLAAELGWQGLARRHALRPPTRGFWVRRCGCGACSLRRIAHVA
jgi:CRP-like cAMP-binding protein